MAYKVDNTNFTPGGNYVYDLYKYVDLTNKDIIIKDYNFSELWFNKSNKSISVINAYQVCDNKIVGTNDTNLENQYYYKVLLSTDLNESTYFSNVQQNPKNLYPNEQRNLIFQIVNTDSVEFTKYDNNEYKSYTYQHLNVNYPFWFTFDIVERQKNIIK
jgi:hypothetical protein